ncbi:MAG: sulfatase-like hydrolase/transferase, partial [Opitutaceae bacterium]
MLLPRFNRTSRIALPAMLSLLAFAGPLSRRAIAATPNIIVIVADDLSKHDLRVNGATDVATPNLDWLANNGVNFRNGYVTAPICSPSRAGLMTGRYQQRFGHETNPGPALETSLAFGLPPSEYTLAERFKALNPNYATGWIGKSHLGWNPPYHPNVLGFDRFLGFLQSHHDYINANAVPRWREDLIQLNGVNLPTNPPTNPNNPVVVVPYLTDLFAADIGSFIDTNATANTPFLLYAPFNAVHFDLQAPVDLVQRFNTANPALAVTLPPNPDPANPIATLTEREKLRVVLFGLDEAVGKILARLRAHPRGPGRTMEDETLIFFTSDNGGDTFFGGDNTPLRGRKTQLYEGGIRVPFLMYWKGQLQPATLDAPVSTLDILPTAIAATGLPAIPPGWNIDGVNLFPYIQNPLGPKPHDRLFWRVETNGINASDDAPDGLRAMREGDWKIVKPAALSTWELYNLATDESETTDQADAEPDRLRRMIVTYNAWSSQMARPRWAWNVLNYPDPAFILEDIRVGVPATSYLATDFLSSAARFAFQDGNNNLRLDGFDPATGFIAQAPVLVDPGLAPLSTAQVGPQWGVESRGASLFYTKPGAGGRNQVWRALPGAPAALTSAPAFDSFGARASRDPADSTVQLAFTAGATASRINVSPPRTIIPIPYHA